MNKEQKTVYTLCLVAAVSTRKKESDRNQLKKIEKCVKIKASGNDLMLQIAVCIQQTLWFAPETCFPDRKDASQSLCDAKFSHRVLEEVLVVGQLGKLSEKLPN